LIPIDAAYIVDKKLEFLSSKVTELNCREIWRTLYNVLKNSNNSLIILKNKLDVSIYISSKSKILSEMVSHSKLSN
jgi:6-pyruvoyl-tetrahydropterin synthase